MKTLIAAMALALMATSVSAQGWTKADCAGLAYAVQDVAVMKLAGDSKLLRTTKVDGMDIDQQLKIEIRRMVDETPMDQLQELPILVLNACLDRI